MDPEHPLQLSGGRRPDLAERVLEEGEESEEEGVKQENEVMVHHRLQKEERENHRREHQLVSFRLSQNQENDDHPSIIVPANPPKQNKLDEQFLQ